MQRNRPARLTLVPALLGILLLAAGCASRIDLPAITPDAGRLSYPGKFVWFDLHTPDMDAAARFYDAVFGWSLERADPGSPRVKTILRKGLRIGTVFLLDKGGRDGHVPGWTPNLSVPDADAARSRALAAGAVPVSGPEDRPYRGRMAEIRDPQGARLILLASPVGDPRDRPLADGAFMGAELWTPDVAGAGAFYAALAGYRTAEVELRGNPYVVLLSRNRPRGGITAPPVPIPAPLWIPQVAVRDVADVLRRVEGAGGTVLLRPESGGASRPVAVFRDPAGGLMGVREFTPAED